MKKTVLLLILCVFAAGANPAFPASPGLLKGKVVVVDPGHGGYDPGAVCGGIYEKNINFQVAVVLKKILEELGARVVMTREADCSPLSGQRGVTQRRDLEKRLEIARQSRADIFLSVHTNSFKGKSRGPEVFYNPDSGKGRFLAECIRNELLSLPGAGGREVKPSRCLVLADTAIPSALLELGFISSPEEKKRLIDAEYQALLAEKIARGVLQYYGRG